MWTKYLTHCIEKKPLSFSCMLHLLLYLIFCISLDCDLDLQTPRSKTLGYNVRTTLQWYNAWSTNIFPLKLLLMNHRLGRIRSGTHILNQFLIFPVPCKKAFMHIIFAIFSTILTNQASVSSVWLTRLLHTYIEWPLHLGKSSNFQILQPTVLAGVHELVLGNYNWLLWRENAILAPAGNQTCPRVP